jgi:hypothetical protein
MSPDVGGFPRLHSGLDCSRDGSQKRVTRQVEGLVPVALVKTSPVLIPWWCVSEQMSLPQSVLEDLNPKTAVISKQPELHPSGNAGRIVVDRARKAERPRMFISRWSQQLLSLHFVAQPLPPHREMLPQVRDQRRNGGRVGKPAQPCVVDYEPEWKHGTLSLRYAALQSPDVL